MTTSASATKCSPPPAQTPLTAAMTGFQTWLCQAVSRSSARLVRRDCSRRASGPWPAPPRPARSWKARPSPVLTITRTAGIGPQFRQAASRWSIIGRVHGIGGTGPIEDQPTPTGPCRSMTRASPLSLSRLGAGGRLQRRCSWFLRSRDTSRAWTCGFGAMTVPGLRPRRRALPGWRHWVTGNKRMHFLVARVRRSAGGRILPTPMPRAG